MKRRAYHVVDTHVAELELYSVEERLDGVVLGTLVAFPRKSQAMYAASCATTAVDDFITDNQLDQPIERYILVTECENGTGLGIRAFETYEALEAFMAAERREWIIEHRGRLFDDPAEFPKTDADLNAYWDQHDLSCELGLHHHWETITITL